MTHPRRSLAAVVAAVVLAVVSTAPGAAAAQGPAPAPRPIVQVGTYDALVSPDYDPVAPLGDVLAGSSTIGLGTFAGLDGELVIVGGVAYRVGLDGTPRRVSAATLTPFAQGVAFRPTVDVPVAPGTSCAALDQLTARLGGAAGVVAVRVRGTFTSLVTRSVPPQTRPYPALADVVATQTVFDLGTRRAVLVGFRTGPAAAGLGAPGLHLHGLTVDRSAGGHVLSCVAGGDVQLSIEALQEVQVVLPAVAPAG